MASRGDHTEARGTSCFQGGRALPQQLPHSLFSLQVLQKQSEKGAVVKLQAQPMDCCRLLSLVIRNLVPPGNDFAF